MRDLLHDPLWRPSDLGHPIPDSPHAVSVAMPTWADVVAYEEEDPATLKALRMGYPRFVCHPAVKELFAMAAKQFGKPGETAIALSSEAACERCAEFLRQDNPTLSPRLRRWPESEVCVLLFPSEASRQALLYWRHAGEIVSSRQAEVLLGKRVSTAPSDAAELMKSRLAEWTGQPMDHVFLFPSGMAAIFAGFRAAASLAPGCRSAQLEFPYVDSLCIPRRLGHGALFFDGPDAVSLLRHAAAKERLAVVATEVPSNPLLRTVDLAQVTEICRKRGIPLMVDDTIATIRNVDVFPHADLVTTSLTKAISGGGDVMAGSLVVSRNSIHAEALLEFLRAQANDGLWREDAAVLEANSRDFPERMTRMNAHAEALFEFLAAHPAIDRVYFPKNQTPENYLPLRKPSGGFGALFSIDLKDPSRAPEFHDRLRVNKGPSLGANFTLACPYTLLAHYRELEWAENHGVSRNLLRVSVGLEGADDLIARFSEALR